MRKSFLVVFAATVAMGTASAQEIQDTARISRHGPVGGEGCTVDVVVDGAAEVEIRGTHAVMHNLPGQAPSFRQFECTGPMPPNAPGFHFNEVDGRGRMELVRTPSGGGAAVVRIDDPQGGSGEYRFELTWFGRSGPQQYTRDGDRGPDRDHEAFTQDREHFFQSEGWRKTLFQRVREDVEHLQHSTFPFTGDQSRLSGTIFELNELQTKLTQGSFDQHELEDVMDSLTNVLQYNRLSPQDRNLLTDDLQRMREFRDHHDDYGARMGRGGDRRDRP